MARISSLLVLLMLFGAALPLEAMHATSAAGSLSVSISTISGPTAAYGDYLVVEAVVTSGGTPVAGASVTFTDTLRSSFSPPMATSDSNGVALTTVQFTNCCRGGTYPDSLNATATASGYSTGLGSTTISLLQASSTQLTVLPNLIINQIAGLSSDVIWGQVNNGWGTCCGAIGGVDVSFTDTIGSTFASPSMTTAQDGGFIVNFTLPKTSSTYDFVTITATGPGYTASSSTLVILMNPTDSSHLSVEPKRFLPSDTTAYNDYLVVETLVTAGGTPVAGATVTFWDGLNSAFDPASVTTNSSGLALTTVQFNNGARGNLYFDTIRATASAPGYTAGTGANTVELLPDASTQLSVWAGLTSSVPGASGSDVISGYVNNGWGNCCGGLGGATVVLKDTLDSSFSSTAVITDKSGFFWTNFTMPAFGKSVPDFITITASAGGYTGSSSTIIAYPNPSAANQLSVNVRRFVPGAATTFNDNLVIEAQVTAGGAPVSRVSVSFQDSFGSQFSPSTATTDSSGIALDTVQFTGHCCSGGADFIAATATLAGYSSGVGSNYVNIAQGAQSQLSVTTSLSNGTVFPGGSVILSGQVYNGWGVCCGTLPGVTVTARDSLGSAFNTSSVVSGKNGYYAFELTLPPQASQDHDFITITAEEGGYSSTSSAAFLEIGHGGSTVTQTSAGTTISQASTQNPFQGTTSTFTTNPTSNTTSQTGSPAGGGLLPFSVLESEEIAAVILVIVAAYASQRVYRGRYRFEEGELAILTTKPERVVRIKSRNRTKSGKQYDVEEA